MVIKLRYSEIANTRGSELAVAILGFVGDSQTALRP